MATKKRVEFVSYDGKYPCLCSGSLTLRIDGVERRFPPYGSPDAEGSSVQLHSGGNVSFDENWSEDVQTGSWSVTVSPDLEELCREIEEVVNDNIDHGCCGGCV